MKEIISANGNLYQLIRVITESRLKNPNMEFNQSSLSSAGNKAMETAVVNVIRAIERKGW